MKRVKILINGIPSSGKSTIAYKLHLALEHLGHETVLLDDEVIKRLDTNKINNLVAYLESPISIIATCDPAVEADLKFWVNTPLKECKRRNTIKLKKEKAPAKGSFDCWEGYYSPGIKIKSYANLLCVLNKKNWNR